MFKKWVVTLTLSLVFLSGVATAADTAGAKVKILISETNNVLHNQRGGGRGEDYLEVIVPKTTKKTCPSLYSTEVKYKMKRFADDVRVISKPLLQCDPKNRRHCSITTSWKHSPAGGLDYKVQIGWVLKPC